MDTDYKPNTWAEAQILVQLLYLARISVHWILLFWFHPFEASSSHSVEALLIQTTLLYHFQLNCSKLISPPSS